MEDAKRYGVVLTRRRERKTAKWEAVVWRITLRGEQHLLEAVEDFLNCLYTTKDASGEIIGPEDCAGFHWSQALTGLAHASK